MTKIVNQGFKNKKFYPKFNKNSDRGLLSINSIFTALILLYFFNDNELGFLTYISGFIVIYAIHEKFGKENAKATIRGGALVLILVSILISVISYFNIALNNVYLPIDNLMTFGENTKMLIGKIALYLVPQVIGIWIYGILKYKTNYKYLWLRSILSMTLSFLISLIIFYLLYDNINVFSKSYIYLLIGFTTLLPILYLIVYILKSKLLKIRLFKNKTNYDRNNTNGKPITDNAKDSSTPKKYGENARGNKKPKFYK